MRGGPVGEWKVRPVAVCEAVRLRMRLNPLSDLTRFLSKRCPLIARRPIRIRQRHFRQPPRDPRVVLPNSPDVAGLLEDLELPRWILGAKISVCPA